jgi:hypothetical protein
MTKWLDCTISPGQFTGEYSVRGEIFNGSGFCLFAERDKLRFDEEPKEGKSVMGMIRVVPGAQKDDLLLVTLPQPTLENGQTITVRANRVRAL